MVMGTNPNESGRSGVQSTGSRARLQRSAAVLFASALLGCSGLDERNPAIADGSEGGAAQPEPEGGSGGQPALDPGPAGAGGAMGEPPGELPPAPDGIPPGIDPGDEPGSGGGGSGNGQETAGGGQPPITPSPGGAGGASVPGAPVPRGASCTLDQVCEGDLVCGLSVSPEAATGRVCCDRACDAQACQGCSTGSAGGVCTALGGNVACIADTERVGACSQPGQCLEYCTVATVGSARVGACLVR